METSTRRRRRSLGLHFLFFAMIILIVSLRYCHAQKDGIAPNILPQKAYNDVEVRDRNGKNNGAAGGGGGSGWGWGNGGGGGGGGGGGRGSSRGGVIGGGGGWGWGGGGGGWWGWGCRSTKKEDNNKHNGRGKYKIGEYAECMGSGRCQGMRLDCPLHCGGLCFYDCLNMCKAHCGR